MVTCWSCWLTNPRLQEPDLRYAQIRRIDFIDCRTTQMLKMFVTRAAKAAWDSAGTVPQTTYDEQDVGEVVEDEEIVEVRVTPDDLGIELPYYPGQGSACGAD